MSNLPKQKCSICGAPDHTHLHCYGTDAQRPVSSKKCTRFQDDPDAPGCCIGCGDAREAHMNLKQRAMSMLSRLVNDAPIGKYEAHELVRQLLEAKWNEPSPDETTDCPECKARWELHHDQYCSRNQGRPGEFGGGLPLETYTNEAPSHPPILPERFNSVSLPEKASGEPIYECCNESCLWRGLESETVHPKHEPSRFLCPECHEVVELV